MTLKASRPLRLFFFSLVYAVQGLTYGFLYFCLHPYLAREGKSPAELGQLLAVASLPFVIKLLWGPLIDLNLTPPWGRRRLWVVSAQFYLAITLVCLAYVVGRQSFNLFVACFFIHNLFLSLQDVSVDTLAIEVLPPHERGFANGLMAGCQRLGMLVGGPLMTSLLPIFDLPGLFALLSVLVSAVLLFTLALKEDQQGKTGGLIQSIILPWTAVLRTLGSLISKSTSPLKTDFSLVELRRSFTCKACLFGLGLAIMANLGGTLVTPSIPAMLETQLGYSLSEYSQLIGFYCGLAFAVGALAGGKVVDKLGRRLGVAIPGITIALVELFLSFLSPYWTQKPLIYSAFLMENLANGMFMGAILALFMDLSNPKIAGIHFSIYMSLLTLGSTAGNWLGGYLALVNPVATLFSYAALVNLVALLWLLPLDSRQARQTFSAAPLAQ